ncbi:ureidoglycolate lyase [Virgibacillus necropolis]|uniref:ureidoglycolate lyase n=1 Tax=Virgibacillus necropolis TaxID=163877 RepID=UPI0013747ED7|nr:ureidoglycolate lyase [Virgibacillus necropolis]
MKIKVIPVSSVDFLKFGRYYNMKDGTKDTAITKGKSFTDVRTISPLINSIGNLGFTLGSKLPSKTYKMERHLHTQEALFCLSDSMIITIAIGSGNEHPLASDVEAFILSPGEVVVLNKGVWHDACHGVGKAVYYYWMATEREDVEDEWVDISPGPVEVYI